MPVSQTERDKWDERYRNGAYEARTHPTGLLAEWAPRFEPGTALDVACGAGRNALYLAALGFTVDAVDISEVGLARARASAAQRGVSVRFIAADLTDPDAALGDGRYDLIAWARYVNDALMPHLLRRLAVGGHLVCEQHLLTDEPVAGPRGPRFRLAPNTLRDLLGGLTVLHYFEGVVADPDGRSVALAQAVARRTV